MKSPLDKIDALSESRVIIYIMVVTAVIFLMLINADPLPDIMEARNLVSARECVDDGNCFITTMNGMTRVRKPPLPTWVTAGAMYITGSTKNIYAARLPNIILMCMASLFVYLTARRWMDKSIALIAALSVVTFFVMENEARRATWDIYTTTFAFGGVWTLLGAMAPRAPDDRETSPPSVWPWLIASIIFWSLSVLSKGPLSIYAVFIPLVATMAITKDRKSYRWWVPVVTIIAAVILGSSWWAYIYLAQPEITAKLSGEVGSWTSKHKNGPLYYLIRTPLLLFPWLVALVGSLILPYIKGRDGRALLDDKKKERIKFFLIWFIISFVLLSLAPQKKYRYLMGMLMPASFALAFFIGELRERGISNLPATLRTLWTLHTAQIPLASIGLIVLTIYSVKELNTPAWLLVFIIPLAALFYFSIKHRGRVGHIALTTIFLMTLTPFVVGLNARDYITRGAGGVLELAEALKVAEDTCDQTLYASRNDLEIVWITGRKNIPIRKDTVIEEGPSLILVDGRDEKNFRGWAATRKLTLYEMYSFRYNESYKIYKMKNAD